MRPGEPPPPSRTRMVRPSFYRSEQTGGLPPDVRDLLIGLMTVADDEGWLLWRPGSIAATLYPFDAHAKRVKSLERRVSQLVEAELLDIKECGCAYLPTLQEHGSIKGGVKVRQVHDWHYKHGSVALRSPTEDSVSVSGSSSSSSSGYVQGSSSLRAREDPSAEWATGLCAECQRPTAIHAPTCSQAVHLKVVVNG